MKIETEFGETIEVRPRHTVGTPGCHILSQGPDNDPVNGLDDYVLVTLTSKDQIRDLIFALSKYV